jgi:hypothetical protein
MKEEIIMRFRRNLPVIIMLLLGILQFACNFLATVPPTTPPEVAEPVTEEPTPPPEEPTAEPPPTQAPTPPTQPTPSSTTAPAGCTNRAMFVTDVTIPDDAVITPGDAFTKTWRLRNSGTCTWTSSYALVFSHGDQMGGAAAVPLAGAVSPGDTVDLSVDLVAPVNPGTYQGFWKLRNNSNVLFGIGASGTDPFWVKIVSQPPSPTPTVTPTSGLVYIPTLMLPLFYADFNIHFVNWHVCGPLDYATFRVENTGNTTLEAIYLQIKDLDTSSWLYAGGTAISPFLANSAQCPPGASALAAGNTAWVAASVGASAPSGHHGRVTLKACTKNDMTGLCKEKTHDFIFP